MEGPAAPHHSPPRPACQHGRLVGVGRSDSIADSIVFEGC
ncbi:hypothetical protein E2C01_066974 [Portunus trituberculatus]|uniref:Uncharacterized protein n=1 Tax=Portunus trituberculatus TaxID=210409 RepID=A0A5B7HMX9_PORTR|nr:hypothetical protein [Portunus trituberculatus]